ncbi:MAG: hypothetical protein ABIM98_06275 [candidate division WOR-3 bacterium]
MGFDIETLEKILVLQEVDRVIFSYKDRLKKLPSIIEKKKKEISEIEGRIKKEEEEIKIMEKEIKGLYLDLEDIEENIKKFERDLFSVKTNEEYRALQSEIEFSKRRKMELEEEILQREEKLEQKKKLFIDFKNKVKNEVEKEKENLRKLEEELTEIPKKIEEAEDLRLRKKILIDKKVLEVYERILSGRGYPAVCEVEIKDEGNDKKFYCSGCSSQIPFFTIDEMMRKGETGVCHYCGRIIYIKKDKL